MTDPLKSLRDRFLVRAKADRETLEILGGAEADPEALRRLVHNLAGVAGTFGYHSVSEAAGLIDDQLASGQPTDTASLARLKAALDAVQPAAF